MKGNVLFQCIRNSPSLKSSSPTFMCSAPQPVTEAFLRCSDFQGLMKRAYRIGSSCKRFRH